MPSSHILPSGGLLTHQFVEAIQQPTFAHPALAPETFALPGKKTATPNELERVIGSAWELLVERWDGIERDLVGMDISTLRDRWIRPLFSLLDLNLEFNRADLVLEGDLRFPISHFAIPSGSVTQVPLHSVLPAGHDSVASLDARREGGSSRASDGGYRRLAPHDLMQRYLNLAHDAVWGIVTDGLRLRLLRDYHHSYTRGFVEFDLQGIFSERDFAAFRALYRLCHASRFLPMTTVETASASAAKARAAGSKRKARDIEDEIDELADEADETPVEEPAVSALTPLESYYQHALSTGVKVGDDLRGSVRGAIEGFGSGFLNATPGLLARLQSGETPVADYYNDILHVIYRVLFLLFAEQRGMFPGRGSLYMEEYSLTALRSLAERGGGSAGGGEDTHTDLWERLKVTFRMVEQGADALGVFGYNGMLFSPEKTLILAGGGAEEPRLRNDALLLVIKKLTTVERDGALQRISYADLSVEEIGSVYESLLDYTPRISTTAEVVENREIAPGMFYLDPRGKARKTSGSYYTHPALVNELIKSALLPVLADRLKAAAPRFDADHPERLSPAERETAEAALLALKVIDPAAGSGAFLIAADNTLALRLAQIRTGDLYPTEREVRKARRDVLANCLYAVDLNPMAVELCKLSLWINAVVEDQKLNFLDHHIRPGNSLVGGFRRLVAKGIPSEAYGGATGDDKELAKAMKKQNDAERAGQQALFRLTQLHNLDDLRAWAEMNLLAQSDPHAAEQRFQTLQAKRGESGERLAYDLWTAAFFWPLEEESSGQNLAERARAGITVRRTGRATPLPPTSHDVAQAMTDPHLVDPRLAAAARQISKDNQFLHWELEFPDVFGENGAGGFDVVLGNPPWERIKLQEKEFFAVHAPDVANAANAAARKRLIEALPQKNPTAWALYRAALRETECTGKFLRDSGRYPLTSSGDINTYSVFAEHDRDLIAENGRGGIIVPSGIATDFTNKDFFADIVENGRLASLFDFENRRGIFPGVHRSYKFSLLTLAGEGNKDRRGAAEFAFFLLSTDDLKDSHRRFTLSASDFALLNPNTRTCPIFRTRADAELTRKLYRAAPVLVNEGTNENPWGIEFLKKLVDLSIHYSIVIEKVGKIYQHISDMTPVEQNDCLPLYEAKLLHQFDHRFASFGTSLHELGQEKFKPDIRVIPRYYAIKTEIIGRLKNYNWSKPFLIATRDITNATNEQTCISTLLPLSATSDSIRLLFPHLANTNLCCMLIANLNSFVLNYVARNNVAGSHLSEYIFKQFPVISCNQYSEMLTSLAIPIIAELIYTCWDLHDYADDIWLEADSSLRAAILRQWDENAHVTGGGHSNSTRPEWAEPETPDSFPRPPFKWDEERRAHLRADLDGLYAHLYGLTRDEFAYILDTFPIVRRKDEAKYGEFRTKRLCLEAYDRLVGSDLIPPEARALQQESVIGPGGRPTTTVSTVPVLAQPVRAEEKAALTSAASDGLKPSQPAEHPVPPAQSRGSEKSSAPAVSDQRAAQKPAASPAEKRRQVKEEPAPAPEEQPMLTDFGLYKCEGCGKMLMGYNKAEHTRNEHKGKDPGYKKLR